MKIFRKFIIEAFIDNKKGSTTINKTDKDSINNAVNKVIELSNSSNPDDCYGIAEHQPSQTFSSGSEWMYSVALRPDGKHIAGGTWDGLVKIWDVNSGDLVAILVEPPPRISSRADYLVLTRSGYYQMSEGLLPMVRAEFGEQLLEFHSLPSFWWSLAFYGSVFSLTRKRTENV